MVLTNLPFLVYFSIFTPAGAILWMLVYAGVFVGYSAPPLRFKARPFLDSLSNAAYAFPLVFTPLVLGASPVWPAALGLMAWSAAKHTFDAVQDIDEDREVGIVTTAVRLGPRGVVFWSGSFWLLSTVGFAAVSLPVAAVNAGYAGALILALYRRPRARDRAPALPLLHCLSLRSRYVRRRPARRGLVARGLPVSRIVVVGGGLGGLASAALLARAGHRVTLLEGNDYLGGKSRRIAVGGQRIDTGPSLVTFPGVWEELLSRLDALGAPGGPPAQEVAGLRLRRLPEVGRYYYRDEVTSLPVPEGHPWHAAWKRFAGLHGGLGPEVTKLLTSDPLDRGTFPALWKLLRLYGTRLTTRGYLEKLAWMPEGLREVIAIHTLNAGVSPARTPALFASMPAVMASDGVWVPDGGVYEIVHSLERLARHAGAEIHTGEPVTRIEPGKVSTGDRSCRRTRS